jgi:hypothetical protein
MLIQQHQPLKRVRPDMCGITAAGSTQSGKASIKAAKRETFGMG